MAYKATDLEVTVGTISSGDRRSTYRDDDVYLIVDEVTGTPGFEIIFTFNGMREVGKYSNQIEFSLAGYYEGTLNHEVKAYIWNYSTEAWDALTALADDFPDETSKQYYTLAVDIDDYVSVERFQGFTGYDREAKIMVQHVDAGNVLHKMHIDQVSLDFITTGTDRHRELLAHA